MLDRADQVKTSHDNRIYNGCQFAVLELEDALRVLSASIKTLRENFDARKLVETKLAGEQVVKVSNQISALTGSVVSAFTAAANRRPRA